MITFFGICASMKPGIDPRFFVGRMIFRNFAIYLGVGVLTSCTTPYRVTPLPDGSKIIELERVVGTWREKNARLLARMAQAGDDCSQPRLIRHFVQGPLESLQRMKASLPRGTNVQIQAEPPNLIFPSFGPCSIDGLTRRGAQIDRWARSFGLEYDGWDADHRPRR